MSVVTIAGTIDFAGKDVSAILLGARALIEAVYDEPGCIHYAWTADVLTPGRIWVYEEWENSATLSAHLAAEPYVAMAAYLGEAGMSGADVHKYRIAIKEPVYDASGVARGDFSGD